METRDPIQRLREELSRKPLFSERNGYRPLDREPLLELLDEIEAQYMRLPMDADGVPIRPGDMMQMSLGESAEVVAVDIERWFFDHSCLADDGDEYDWKWAEHSRHVKDDTVESVLCELSDAAMAMHSVGFMPIGEIRKYAERIRKAVQDGD